MTWNWTITPWNDTNGGITRLLQDFATTGVRTRSAVCESPGPALAAWETEDAYSFELDVPGLADGDVEIELLDGILTVRGTWAHTLPEGAETLRNERPAGEFCRTVRVPGEVDETGVQAELALGVLRVTLPKRPEVLPRRIEIAPGNKD
jgi:HSP20 family molecular chaperone IbpA